MCSESHIKPGFARVLPSVGTFLPVLRNRAEMVSAGER
jgi:hypothetical protein